MQVTVGWYDELGQFHPDIWLIVSFGIVFYGTLAGIYFLNKKVKGKK